MILLQRKVLPRPGRPTRMIMSFCLSTRFRFRTFRGPCLWREEAVSTLGWVCHCSGGRRNVGFGGCHCTELSVPR